MEIKKIVSFEMDQNCYLLTENGYGILIDPGLDTPKILSKIENYKVNYILLTHCHFDHLNSLNKIRGLKKVVGTKNCSINMLKQDVSLCEKDFIPERKCDIEMKNGEEMEFDGIKVKCIHTPGHTKGSCCYLIDGKLFSGDTLFYQSIGRWDLPTGNYSDLENSIREKIYNLDENIVVYPGHGRETCVGHEKKYNAFITE